MQPITRGNAADTNVAATQYLLSDKRDHDGVINIMVGRVAKAGDSRYIGIGVHVGYGTPGRSRTLRRYRL
jgi:hypothetical protein